MKTRLMNTIGIAKPGSRVDNAACYCIVGTGLTRQGEYTPNIVVESWIPSQLDVARFRNPVAKRD